MQSEGAARGGGELNGGVLGDWILRLPEAADLLCPACILGICLGEGQTGVSKQGYWLSDNASPRTRPKLALADLPSSDPPPFLPHHKAQGCRCPRSGEW